MKHLLKAILCLIITNAYAQVKLQGIIKDSIGNPLELANVIAINQETKKLDSYAITNSKGQYLLNLTKNASYKVQVSFIGMKSAEVVIATKSENLKRNFTLTADNTLDEVEVKYEMPVTIKGDTIVYNADSFKTGSERKLEDILENLPGVEINDDGEVEIEGKKVGKVLVEDKEFFDGNTKLATKNIPADAVDKVQVLKNYSNVGQLSGVTNNQDNIALNIKLKKGKKSFWFGTITAGGGASDDTELYLAQPKLFYYNPKYSINIISDLNNIGEVAFTRRDFFNFTGSFRAPSTNSGTSISLGNNNLNFLTQQNNRAREINTKFGALNFSYSPKKTLDIGGFGIFSSSRTRLQENNFINYVVENPVNQDEDLEQNTIQKSDLVLAKFTAKYKPNFNNQLDYSAFGRTSKESQEQTLVSSVNGAIVENDEANPYSISQNLNYYYTLNENNIFAFEAQHLLQDEDPFYSALLGNDPLNNEEEEREDRDSYDDIAEGLGLNRDLAFYSVGQEKRVKSNQLDAKLDYWNVLNTKSNINFTLGAIYSNQKFESNLFQFLENNIVSTPATVLNDGLNTNDINYTFSDTYLGVHYRFKTGIFTITPGFSTHAYNVKNTQFSEKYNDNFFRVLPDFNARIQFKKSESLTIDYRMQNQFTDVNQFAEGLVLNSYGSLFSGDPELENALSHSVSLFYSSFNLFNYTNVFARVAYTSSIDRIRNSSEFDFSSNTSIRTPINSQFADETLSAFGRFERRFGKIQARVNANFNYNKFNQVFQEQRNINKSYIQTYGGRIRTNFREAPNVTLSYRHTINDNDFTNGTTKFITQIPSVEFDAYIFKSITFLTNFSYTKFSDENRILNQYKVWDASLAYRKDKDSKWEYELKATNLLDTKSQNSTSSGNISVRATEYFIQPRFLTFRLRYSL